MSHYEPDGREMPPAPLDGGQPSYEDVQRFKDTCDLLNPEGPVGPESGRGNAVCAATMHGVMFELGFDCRLRRRNPGLDVVLEPTPEFLAISDPKEARAALSQHLGVLGDLMWATWQQRHPEGAE